MMKYLLCFVLLACCAITYSQPIVWNRHLKDISISQKVFVLEDKYGSFDINTITTLPHHEKFVLSKQDVLHFGFTNSVYWIRFDLDNTTSDQLLLSLDQAFIPFATLFYKNGAKEWDSIQSGYKIPLYNKKLIDHFQLFPLPQKKASYYLRVQPYLHAIPIHIIEEKQWNLKAISQKLSYGIYAGILLFAIVINLFLFIALRKIYFLNYSVLVLFYLMTSALVMEGYTIYFFPGIDLMFWYKIVPVLDMPALLLYCIAFFQLKQNHHRVYKIVFSCALFFIGYLLMVPFLPLMFVLLLNQIFALVVFVLGIYIGLVVGKSGNRLGYFFACAYSLWFVLVSVEAAYIQTGFPKHFSSISYVSAAIFIEAFLLAFLQSKRFQWEKRADDLKQFEMKSQIEKMEQDFQRELLNTKLEIQEQTVNRISQEIHDNVGQMLSLAKVQANIIEQKKISEATIFKELKENIGQALADLRNISKNLNSDHILLFDLKESVVQQIERINTIGLTINISTEGPEQTIAEQKKLVLFRIIQEGFQNIIKHANATQADIIFHYCPNELTITISDNGAGFDTTGPNNFGLGLNNIIHRAKFVGGHASIDSSKNLGTKVTIVVPYDEHIP